MAALGLAGLPVYQQQPQQQQQIMMQQPQMMMQQPTVVQPTPLDATVITIKLATLAGERFKDVFYTVFDAHRTDLHRFFVPHSQLVWEGTPVQGNQNCKQLFEMLPSSKHTISTLDVQPVTGGMEMRGSVNTLLVTITGTVSWGMSGSESSIAPSGFYHTFILERSPSQSSSGKQVHHVIYASMRTRQQEESQGETASQTTRVKRGRYSGNR